MMTILSLGAGVQSSTMALTAAEGWIKPMPDCAIFADTGWEPAAVYRHLDWLMPQLPFPVHIVSAGNIRDGLVAGSKGHRWASIPASIRRQCTKEYKIVRSAGRCANCSASSAGARRRSQPPRDGSASHGTRRRG